MKVQCLQVVPVMEYFSTTHKIRIVFPGVPKLVKVTHHSKEMFRAVGRSENLGVPVVIRWA